MGTVLQHVQNYYRLWAEKEIGSQSCKAQQELGMIAISKFEDTTAIYVDGQPFLAGPLDEIGPVFHRMVGLSDEAQCVIRDYKDLDDAERQSVNAILNLTGIEEI
jgi:hypothetical protein